MGVWNEKRFKNCLLILLINYEYEKYITDNDHILDTLNKYGAAIIPNILNQQECNLNKYKFKMWKA
jgi:hypothetical protein